MIRLIELALFLTPFALFAAWWVLGAAATPRILAAACVALGVLGGGLLWFGTHRQMDPGERYVPAHLENGRILPAIGVPAPP